MRSNFIAFVENNKPVVFDGGMGSMLIENGMGSDDVPELWNIEKSELIQSIHKQYYDAGANVVLTNTFGGSSLKLKTRNLEKRVGELNEAAVNNVKIVRSENGYIAGDIGPSGLFLPPVGNCTEDAFYGTYNEQAHSLINAGVDLIAIETMYDLREILQAVKAVRKINASIPLIASMTFNKKKRGFFTIMGDTLEKSFDQLERSGADIIGVNCTLASSKMLELCQIAVKLTDRPLILQPNAGQPIVSEVGNVTYSQTPKEFADDMSQMIELGASIVGGCCGTTPEFIKELVGRLPK
ncbi:MAG: homocysteine S-methyltransferase family protein [Candidatus Kariarchaeaceae archaeon]|jgi:5-methyltetrahydrofolate--homocysteine methyltransferase